VLRRAAQVVGIETSVRVIPITTCCGTRCASEVLVVSYGFSPSEIRADQGEEIVLRVRRSAESLCTSGLTIPERHLEVQLPLDETVPVTLKLDRAETIELQCANEDVRASIVVAPR